MGNLAALGETLIGGQSVSYSVLPCALCRGEGWVLVQYAVYVAE